MSKYTAHMPHTILLAQKLIYDMLEIGVTVFTCYYYCEAPAKK